ncbi:ABC transporter permease [Methylacidimicrobium tartarophylax]|nr:ABC transporter permease [Methylacidimicrobium tartarophylax]
MPRSLPGFLALRYLRPRRSFVSVITLLSLLGVTLGVLVLVVVLAVMAGFERELQDKIIGFNAHLVVSNGEVLHHPDQEVSRLLKEPGVKGAAPFVSGPVLAEYADRITTPILRGIDPQAELGVIPLRRYLVAGKYNLQADTVLVGDEWAKRNGATVGDKVVIYAPRHLQALRDSAHSGKQSIPLPTELEISGIFRTGLFEYDSTFFLTSLQNAQYLYGLGHGVHGIALRVQNPMAADRLKARLNTSFPPPMEAITWMDQNRPLFTAIAVEKVTMAVILFFIILVAAFGLCSTLITITAQKRREIGLLKALGATDGQVLGIFIFHGLIVGLLGTAAGLILAALALRYLNVLRELIGRTLGIDLFSADVYHFATIPVVIDPPQIAGIAVSAVLLCICAAWIPAWNAARLLPANALRYE